MASLINFVKSKLRRKLNGPCLVLGLDAAGKTTFLYRYLLGEFVTTIPTIGFNVETLKTWDKKEVTCWDVGGCDKIRPLVRHYFVPGMSILFIIDIHDNRLNEALEELDYQVREAGNATDGRVAFVGIMLNKQDLPDSTPELLETVKMRVQSTMLSYRNIVKYRIFDAQGLSAKTGEGLQEVIQTVIQEMEAWVPRASPDNDIHDETRTLTPDTPPTREELLKRIEDLKSTKAIAYQSPELFLANMLNGKLSTWDHADHLYVACIILNKILEDPAQTTTPQQPVIAAVDMFLDYLVTMLQEVPGKFRNTAHRTLTTFWVYQVYIAMYKIQEPPSAHTKKQDNWPDKFFFLLENNPDLMNGGLWKENYTKNYLFSPEAKDNLVTPDVEALPQFNNEKPQKKVTGYDAKRHAEDQTARRLKRWAYATLQVVKATNSRRGLVIKNALTSLQSETIRQRISNPRIEPYSETQAYFWIQIVHAGMEGILKKSSSFDFSKVPYETVEILYPEAFGDEDLWKEYYKEEDWKGVAGRMNFVPPTKKGKVIPNVSPILDIFQDWKTAVSDVVVPTIEELKQRATWISNYEMPKKEVVVEEPKPSKEPIATSTGTFHEADDDDDWVDVKDITPHVSKVKISDNADQAPNYGKALPKPEPPSEKPPARSEKDLTPQGWQEHAEMIHTIFEKLPKKQTRINHKDISHIAYYEVNKESSKNKLTKMTFWVRMIIEAYVDTYGPPIINGEPNTAGVSDQALDIDLHDFLSKNLELCWEDLWLVYFTELTWKSATAGETILGCDRKQLRSVRGWKERSATA
ncbi:ubiquitinyl hydrolase 1 [Orbilia ellipsospora]|uniref:Ubiquitinyl hydrolase 1 n=1 Tax=Orbilia ellipsospora TaxID=2528407 RepID=A0AAV9XE74_9PEZI